MVVSKDLRWPGRGYKVGAVCLLAAGLLTCASAQRTAFGSAAPAVTRGGGTAVSFLRTETSQFSAAGMRGCCAAPLPANRIFNGASFSGAAFNGTMINGAVNGSLRNRNPGVQFRGEFRSHHRHSNLVYVPFYYPVYPVVGYSSAGYPSESMASSNVSAYDDSEPVTPSARQPDPSWTEGEAIMRDRRTASDERASDQRAGESRNRAATGDVPAKAAEEALRTTLVFKDRRPRETVVSYAIVGGMLLDLNPTHRRKIALSDLDLPETARVNEQDGVDFRLPAAPVQK